MPDVCYLSGGKLFHARDGMETPLPSEAVDQYRLAVKEINEKRGWKLKGPGAGFMGAADPMYHEGEVTAQVESVVAVSPEKLIYAAALETSAALYNKNPETPTAPEGYILRKTDTRIYHIDYCPGERLLVGSASEGYIQKHLALCNEDKPNYRLITEGECVDITPSFSRQNPNLIFFSSAGYYVDREKRKVHYSSYGINRFDRSTETLTEILTDEQYNFTHPLQTADGSLYCIRTPKRQEGKTSFVDVLMAPVRLSKAVFGFLNIFTQRYSGESLIKGADGAPSKGRQKSDEELFVEGNLANADKSLKENALAGEKHPGTAPGSWELVQVHGGQCTVVKKGVMDYTFDSTGALYFSNGKYILRRSPSGDEQVVCQAKLAKSICVLEPVEQPAAATE